MILGSVVIPKSIALAVRLTAGSSLSYPPDEITNAIFQKVGVTLDTDEIPLPCSQASSPSTLNFTFSSVTISAPMSEFVFVIEGNGTYAGHPETAAGGKSACIIAPAGDTSVDLGDTFLRSAYVVFDLDNNEISMAQTNFNATGPNVLEIGTGKEAVPDATLVQNPVTATTASSELATATNTETGSGSELGGNAKSGAEIRTSKTALGLVVVLGWTSFYVG